MFWLISASVFALRAVSNSVRLRRLKADARPTSVADLECGERNCETLRAGNVSLALSDEIRSPILLGVLRPMIVLPADIASWTSPVERHSMLRHELAHVARRDHYVNLFQTILGAVFFFHPLARYACRQLSVEREMACDDHVVASGAEAEAYAESIIKVAERSIALAGVPGSAHQLALFSTRELLERRIEMILNKNRTSVTTQKLKYLILPAALIAVVAWMLIPPRLTKPGLAQQANQGDRIELMTKYMGDSKGIKGLVETALANPDPESRRNAFLRLILLEGDESTDAMVHLYNETSDPEFKTLVIDTLGWRSEIVPLTKIALFDQSAEYRRRALQTVKWLKATSKSEDVKAWDVSALQDQLNELSQEPSSPPLPPPLPSPAEMTTVESDEVRLQFRWQKASDSVFDLLRKIAYARMRRNAAFFERVLDEDFVGIGPDSETRNKADQIAEFLRLDSIKKFEFDDLRVSGNDEIAFATFLATLHYQVNGQDRVAQYRYAINFIKKDVPLDDKVVVELDRTIRIQGSCLKCHTNDTPWIMPTWLVVGRKPAEIESIPDKAQSSLKHADVFLPHPRQLKIAAIHMNRKQ